MKAISNSKLILVVGSSRSGTTMMSRIVGNNPEVHTFEELHFFEQLWSPEETSDVSAEGAIGLAATLLCIERDGYLSPRLPQKYQDEAKDILLQAGTPVQPPVIYASVLDHETKRAGRIRPCEQTPRNVFYIEEIMELFPEAKILEMVRDPRDILLSQKRRWRQRFLGAKNAPFWNMLRVYIGYHPITITQLWNSAVNAAEPFADKPYIRTVMFERLLENPELEVREICEFLELPFEPGMLNVPNVGSSTTVHRTDQYCIDPTKKEQWRRGGLSRAEIYLCQLMARKYMDRFGYKPVSTGLPIITIVLYACVWPIQIALALLFNFRRAGSILSTIRRRLA